MYEKRETLQAAAEANGNGTPINLSGIAALAVQITGTFSATINFEATIDGTNWIAAKAIDLNTGSPINTTTATGIFMFNVPGLRLFRARISSYSSGSVTITAVASSAPAKAYSWLTLCNNSGEYVTVGAGNEDNFITGHRSLNTRNYASLYNQGADRWDRHRNNTEATLLASAERTSTASSADQTNHNARGVLVTLNVTATSDTPSLTLKIEAKMGDNYEKLLEASAAVTAVGTHTYIVYPGAGAAAEDVVESQGFPLPRTWRVTVTHADSDPATYSVEASLIL